MARTSAYMKRVRRTRRTFRRRWQREQGKVGFLWWLRRLLGVA